MKQSSLALCSRFISVPTVVKALHNCVWFLPDSIYGLIAYLQKMLAFIACQLFKLFYTNSLPSGLSQGFTISHICTNHGYEVLHLSKVNF